MVVLVQNSINRVAFQLERAVDDSVFTFDLVKREDLVPMSFQSVPDPDLDFRIPSFTWEVTSNPASDDPANDIYFMSVGQYEYVVMDSSGNKVDSGMIRVDALQRDAPTEYNVTETFKVYGQK